MGFFPFQKGISFNENYFILGKELPGPGTVISSLEARFINPCMGK